MKRVVKDPRYFLDVNGWEVETRFVRAYVDADESAGLEFERIEKFKEDKKDEKIRLVREGGGHDWLYGLDKYAIPLESKQFWAMVDLVKQDYPHIECVFQNC